MLTAILVFGLSLAIQVSGHGRLMEPPARNAMWRYGYPNPVNYNDNELYCGGFVVHYIQNGGKCGICGDNYKDETPRKHEARGVYGNGINVRRYVMGQVINITAELTTNHWGFMVVKLCPNNDKKKTATQECMDKYTLKLAGKDTDRFEIPEDTKKVETFTWQVQLPEGLTCSQCVLQWTYFAGNTWGACPDGTGHVGCGDQETFINCADVAILSNTAHGGPKVEHNPWVLYYRGNEYQSVSKLEPLAPPMSLRPLIIRSQLCIPVGKYAKVNGMDEWCRINCLKYPPNCHPDACKCVHECEPIGDFALEKDSDVYCNQYCLGHPSICPEDKCRCF